MFLPVWAIVLLGLGWLGFLWLLVRRDGGRDLTQAPATMARPAPAAPAFPLPDGPGPAGIPPEALVELRLLVAQGQKIHAIKRLRELTRCSLADARHAVERL